MQIFNFFPENKKILCDVIYNLLKKKVNHTNIPLLYALFWQYKNDLKLEEKNED